MRKTVLLISMLVLALLPLAAESQYKTIEDLNGRNIGVQTAVLYEELIQDRVPDSTIQYYTMPNDMILALTSGKVDAYLIEEVSFGVQKKNHPELEVIEEPAGYISATCIIGENERQDVLLSQLNQFIADSWENGLLDELYDYWIADFDPVNDTCDTTGFTGENGTIAVAVEGGYEPFSFISNGQISGFDVDFICRFARAYGYAECRLRRADTDAEKHWRYFAGECICPLQNRVILLRTGLRKHDESLNPLLEQEMNVNELNASPSLALLQERLNYLRDQVAERRADPNRLFYEQLWTLVEPFVKQLENVGFRPSESDFASVGFGSVSDFLHRLRDALRRGGLEVVCSPEECVAGTDEEDCFIVSRDAGFATPAIVRRSDGYVFVKGVRPAD